MSAERFKTALPESVMNKKIYRDVYILAIIISL